MTVRQWVVPLKKRARLDIEKLMFHVGAYLARHVNIEREDDTGFRVTLDGPSSEPFATLIDPEPRVFRVRLVEREMHVTATDPDSFTHAVAEGWARAAARAWETEVRAA